MIEDKLDQIISLLTVIAKSQLNATGANIIVNTELIEETKKANEAAAATVVDEKPKRTRRTAKEIAADKAAADEAALKTVAVAPPAVSTDTVVVQEKPKITKAQLSDHVLAAVALHGREKVQAAIATFDGAERASLVPEDQWADVIAAVKAIQ